MVNFDCGIFLSTKTRAGGRVRRRRVAESGLGAKRGSGGGSGRRLDADIGGRDWVCLSAGYIQ